MRAGEHTLILKPRRSLDQISILQKRGSFDWLEVKDGRDPAVPQGSQVVNRLALYPGFNVLQKIAVLLDRYPHQLAASAYVGLRK